MNAFLPTTYNPWVVGLSLLMAVSASYVALDLAGRVRGRARVFTIAWTAGGAVVMGSGVWSMHFVGMLAVSLPIALSYDLAETMLSWAAAVAVSGLALHIAARERLGARTLAIGALLMGAGICAMHYLGMAALDLEPGIVWNPWLVLASALIAVVASAVALLVFFGLRRLSGLRAHVAQLLAALLMGAAISGMHYTAMAAAGFPVGAVCRNLDGLSGSGLGGLLALSTLGMLSIAVLTSALDARLQAKAHQAEQERDARELADAANREKTAFLARMSHELRTPLNAIHGFAELMLSEPRPQSHEVQQHRLELIVNSSRHLLALIDDLLDVSRIELGRLDVHVASTELVAVAQAAIGELEEQALRRGVSVKLVHEPRALWALADPLRTRQVLSNLLSNAIKYNRPAGSVTIELAQRDGWVRIAVADTGQGMTAEQLAALYQPFNRLGRDAEPQGAGIGLVIAKHLVEGMGGRIEVDSEADAGTCFTVWLARSSEPQAAPAVAPARPLAERADVRGAVLYVEDDPVNQLLMQSCLALRPGVSLLMAADGTEGIATALCARPDLVITDMMLPDMHGSELAQQLRAVLGAACPPLIAFSANAMPADIAAARAAGFADYLVKPATTQALLATIDRALAHAAPRSAATATSQPRQTASAASASGLRPEGA
ncbi:MHYT domain-containing protein [Caldimonas sp. KR1-144]|uniref:MHYT domain-containing protein n=1 Tax=Caldimonas sp. KR1-144 TaxID=3400911 RepID=UPI003C090945